MEIWRSLPRFLPHVAWWFHRKRIVNNLPVLEAKEEDKVGFRRCHSHKVQERPLPRPTLKRPRICSGFSLLFLRFWGFLSRETSDIIPFYLLSRKREKASGFSVFLLTEKLLKLPLKSYDLLFVWAKMWVHQNNLGLWNGQCSGLWHQISGLCVSGSTGNLLCLLPWPPEQVSY